MLLNSAALSEAAVIFVSDFTWRFQGFGPAAAEVFRTESWYFTGENPLNVSVCGLRLQPFAFTGCFMRGDVLIRGCFARRREYFCAIIFAYSPVNRMRPGAGWDIIKSGEKRGAAEKPQSKRKFCIAAGKCRPSVYYSRKRKKREE